MTKDTDDPAFRAWVANIFGTFRRRDRWCDEDFDPEKLSPDERVSRLTLLFRGSGRLLEKYDDVHVGRGLNYLSDSGIAPYAEALFKAPPDQARVTCIETMEILYRDCWAKRCVPDFNDALSGDEGMLNHSCYIWWELLGYYGDCHRPERRRLDEAALGVMECVLSIPHLACRQSALYGLNQWRDEYPDRVRQIITRFLYHHPEIPVELKEYASGAIEGRL